MHKALFTSEFWFDLLNDNDELFDMLKTAAKPRKRHLLGWLSRIIDKRPEIYCGTCERLVGTRYCAQRAGPLSGFVPCARIPEDNVLITLLSDVTRSTEN